MSTLRVDATPLGGGNIANTPTTPRQRTAAATTSSYTRPIVRPTTASRLRQARVQAVRQQQVAKTQAAVYAPSIVSSLAGHRPSRALPMPAARRQRRIPTPPITVPSHERAPPSPPLAAAAATGRQRRILTPPITVPPHEHSADAAFQATAKPAVRNESVATAGKTLVPGIKAKAGRRAAVPTRAAGATGSGRNTAEYFLQSGDAYWKGK